MSYAATGVFLFENPMTAPLFFGLTAGGVASGVSGSKISRESLRKDLKIKYQDEKISHQNKHNEIRNIIMNVLNEKSNCELDDSRIQENRLLKGKVEILETRVQKNDEQILNIMNHLKGLN